MNSRIKGFNAEREVVRIALAQGLEAKRTPCSRYPDVLIQGRPVSVKRVAKYPKWFEKLVKELEKHDYLLIRKDNAKWIKIEYWQI